MAGFSYLDMVIAVIIQGAEGLLSILTIPFCYDGPEKCVPLLGPPQGSAVMWREPNRIYFFYATVPPQERLSVTQFPLK